MGEGESLFISYFKFFIFKKKKKIAFIENYNHVEICVKSLMQKKKKSKQTRTFGKAKSKRKKRWKIE